MTMLRAGASAVAVLLLAMLAVPLGAFDATDELSVPGQAAAKRALAVLAGGQQPTGAWGGSWGGSSGVVGVCALALMGHGNLPGEGDYGTHTAKALQFLVRSSQPDGLLFKRGMPGPPMYHHGLATLALAEGWGESHDKDLRDALKRACELIIATQNAQGGWRYEPKASDADLSATVIQLMALRAAKDAGIAIPKETIDGAISYVRACHNAVAQGKDGGFGYTPGNGSGWARTGAGITSLQLAGLYRTPEVADGVAYLNRFQPIGQEDPQANEHWFYGAYYATMGLYQAQSSGQAAQTTWRIFYPAMVNSLLGRMDKGGWWGGGWDQYPTAMSLLILAVPNRYLPIYQR